MSRVLLVGKGAPDRGGIPSYLEHAAGRGARSDARAHASSTSPTAARRRVAGPRSATCAARVRDALAVWRAARGHDIVHIHSALAPAVTVLRAGAAGARRRAAEAAAVIVHAHGGDVQSWLTSPLRRCLTRLAMQPAHRVVAVWTAGRDAAAHGSLPADRVRLIDNGVRTDAVPAGRRHRTGAARGCCTSGCSRRARACSTCSTASTPAARARGRPRAGAARRHARRGPGRRGGGALGRRTGTHGCWAPGRRSRCRRCTPRPTCSACRRGGRRCRCRCWRRWRPGCRSSPRDVGDVGRRGRRRGDRLRGTAARSRSVLAQALEKLLTDPDAAAPDGRRRARPGSSEHFSAEATARCRSRALYDGAAEGGRR